MFQDHQYNILSQLVTEQRSLWRIKKYYLKNSKGCKKCQTFFNELINVKQKYIKELLNLWKEHGAKF